MAINRATFSVTDNALEFMVLEKSDLPSDFAGHQLVREGLLDNATMAQQGFPGNTEEKIRNAGRVTGFLREFGPTSNMPSADGFDFLAATVAHLFDDPASVPAWMTDIFIKDFEDNVGERVGDDHQLVSATRLETKGVLRRSRGPQGRPRRIIGPGVIHHNRLSGRPPTGRSLRSHHRRPHAPGPDYPARPGPGKTHGKGDSGGGVGDA